MEARASCSLCKRSFKNNVLKNHSNDNETKSCYEVALYSCKNLSLRICDLLLLYRKYIFTEIDLYTLYSENTETIFNDGDESMRLVHFAYFQEVSPSLISN